MRFCTQVSVMREPVWHVFARMHEIEMGKSSYMCRVRSFSEIYVFETRRSITIVLVIFPMLECAFVFVLHS